MSIENPVIDQFATLPWTFNGEHYLMDDVTRIPGSHNASELCQLVGNYDPAKFPPCRDFPTASEAYVDAKLSGIRALFIGGDKPTIVTREGNVIRAASRCMHGLRTIEERYGQPMFFDGEFVDGSENQTIGAFRRGVGGQYAAFYMFDAVPLDQWAGCTRTAPLSIRRELLERMAPVGGDHVGMLKGYLMDRAMAERWAQDFWARKFEGIVVKDPNSEYVRGRSQAWMKLKEGNL